MKTQLDMNKIAKGLGAERQGKVAASGGYFGAMQLAALLIEKTAEQFNEDEVEDFVCSKRLASR